MKRLRGWMLAVAAVALFTGSAYAFCPYQQDIACNSECRSVGGVVACYWKDQAGIGCTNTYSGCSSGQAECCGFKGGF